MTAPTLSTTPLPPPPSVGMPAGNLQAPPAYPDAGLPAVPPPVITTPAISTPNAALPVAPPPSVDAQIAFPATTVAQAGHPLVLTTIVTRRTDRVPLAGWTVRYEVAGPSAALGSVGGNRVEVPTDANGRASIEIRPTSAGLGEAIVSMAVLAPPDLAAAATPGAEIGRSSATITWKAGVPGAPPWLPPPPGLASAMPSPSLVGPPSTEPLSGSAPPSTTYSDERPPNRFQPPPSLSDNPPSDNASPPKTYAPPPKQEPTGKPELVVEVRRRSPERVEVGGFASFDVIVTNRGDAMARDIVVLDRFDPGLSHVRAQDNELAVKYEGMRDLPPGESATVPLTFGVRAGGQQCHTVTITAEGVAAVVDRGCVTAVEAKPASPPTLEVTKQGPIRHYVNELALFNVVIKNTGDVPVTNIELTDHYDAALEPRFSDPGVETLPDGRLRWRIARLEKGERRQFKVTCACVSPARSACSMATVTADGDLSYADEKCVEILPLATTPPSASGGVAPPPPLPAENLKLSMRSSANPARVGVPLTLFVFVENIGRETQRDVELRVQLPQETTPDQTQIQPSGMFQIVGQREVRFSNLGDVGPGERREIEIPLTADRPAIVTFVALASAAGTSTPLVSESDPVQIEAASQ